LSTVDGGPEDDGRTSFAAGLAQTKKKTKTMARSSPSWYRPAGASEVVVGSSGIYPLDSRLVSPASIDSMSWTAAS